MNNMNDYEPSLPKLERAQELGLDMDNDPEETDEFWHKKQAKRSKRSKNKMRKPTNADIRRMISNQDNDDIDF